MTNWIILIVAGFFESCFAFCLGKMKGVVGLEYQLHLQAQRLS